MAIIKCKMCGGDLALTEGSTIATCEYCGTRQTVPSMDDEKKLILFAFAVFTVSFVYTAFFGSALPIPPAVQGYILCAVAAPAMAIFGILPQAVVADIAECDALETGENRSGMFYAARTFSFKLGQSIAMLLVTAFATIGQESGLGYRITAVAAAAVCMLGGVLFMLYDEKKVYDRIAK